MFIIVSISVTQSIKIIADLSSNHNGDIQVAKKMIDKAKEAGVDIIKTQSWQAKKLSKNFKGDFKSAFERHQKTELSNEDHKELIKYCKNKQIEYLTTIFDLERVDFIKSLGLKKIKVASSDCASTKLLKKLKDNFETIYLSTGMSTAKEIINTINLLQEHDYVILHCVSIYPTPLDKSNLNKINWLKKNGARKVGFSDHSLGTDASIAAMSMGVEIIEKHLTLDRNLPGKDQAMSTEPHEFKKMSDWRNLVEKMMGEEQPTLSRSEKTMREIYIGKWGNNR